MHKYLLLVAAAALALPARAQTQRGAKLLGVSVGDLRYTTYSEAERRELSAALYPSVGWFVADRLAVGTTVLVGYERYRTFRQGPSFPVESRGHSLTVGVAPFVRYYLYDGSKHKLFGQAGGEAAYNTNRSRREEGLSTYTYSGNDHSFGFHAGLGYNYFITPNVALEALTVYRRRANINYVPDRFDGRFSPNSLDVRLGFSVFLFAGPTADAP